MDCLNVKICKCLVSIWTNMSHFQPHFELQVVENLAKLTYKDEG